MKKLILALSLTFVAGAINTAYADTTSTEMNDSVTAEADSLASDSLAADSAATDTVVEEQTPEEPAEEAKAEPKDGLIYVIKQKIIEGGVEFMLIVVLCLIIGLTVAVERVITLNLATTNTKKMLKNLREKLFSYGIQSAREYVVNTRGPIAAIFSQGLLRLKNDESVSDIESSVINHGSAELAKLEKGMSWINLFISLAPMFGFMGTVIGMIQAFDKIQETGEMEISSLGGDIKVALLTTVAGLIVAIILQIFYNYCVAKIEDLSSNMEESSNTFMDMVSKYKRDNQ